LAYVTQAILEANFSVERVAQFFSAQATDGSTTGAVDAATMAAVIASATDEVNELLIGVTVLPFVTVPGPVTEITGIYAMYRASLRRPEYMIDPKRSPFRQQYEDARSRLDSIRKGYMRVSSSEPPKNVGGSIANYLPESIQPNVFLSDSSSGEGGFNDGGM